MPMVDLTTEKLKTLQPLVKSKVLSVTKICNIVGISCSVHYRAIANGVVEE